MRILKRSLNIRTFSDDDMPGNCKIWHLACILLVIAALLLAPNQAISQGDSIYQDLADIDAGRKVAPDDITVARFRTLVRMLAKRFNLTEERFADISVVLKTELRKDGIDEKILNILEGFNRITSHLPVVPRDYVHWMSYYVASRGVAGWGHAETLSNFELLLETFGQLDIKPK